MLPVNLATAAHVVREFDRISNGTLHTKSLLSGQGLCNVTRFSYVHPLGPRKCYWNTFSYVLTVSSLIPEDLIVLTTEKY